MHTQKPTHNACAKAQKYWQTCQRYTQNSLCVSTKILIHFTASLKKEKRNHNTLALTVNNGHLQTLRYSFFAHHMNSGDCYEVS